MLSFWEQNSFLKYDFIIVGSGIVGLSAAANLKEQLPDCSVLVLERGILPSGASTKNAGFACFGSLTEILSDFKTMGEVASLQLIARRWQGLQQLQQRLGAAAIGLQNKGGYELLDGQAAAALEQIDDINKKLRDIFGQKVFDLCDEKIAEFGFNAQVVRHLVMNPLESQIDTGLMMRSLLGYVQRLGVQVLTGSEVLALENLGTAVAVQVRNSISAAAPNIEFKAGRQVLICVNAFAQQLLPHLNLRPGRGQVLMTKPIKNLKMSGTFHMDEGFYYFRDYESRLLLGGGRNLDFDGEATTELATTEYIMHHLEEKLRNVILPQIPFQIESRWAGIMAFGDTKAFICERINPFVSVGVRCGGMGIALGSAIGQQLAAFAID